MNNLKCIAFTGGKQNGKSTAVKLCENLLSSIIPTKYQYVHGFAWDLKLELCQMFSGDAEYDYEIASEIFDHLKEQYPHVRKLLQGHGDYQKEKHGMDYWINKVDTVVQEIKSAIPLDQQGLLCIPDLRFINEMNYLINMFPSEDLLVLRILRTPMPENFTPDNHVSETELNSIRPDEVVENPWGDLPKFKSNLQQAIIRKGWLKAE